MIVQHFLKWSQSADVSKRATAASALARAYLTSDMGFDERCGADAAMTLLLDDPSPKVRLALAEAVASSRFAPPQIVAALAGDQYEIASLVIARSPLLRDGDLIARVEIAEPRLQTLIANRPEVSTGLAMAIAENGHSGAVAMLLANANARVDNAVREKIIEKHIGDAAVRGALLNDPDLSPVHRFRLLEASKQAFAVAPFVTRILGDAGARRISGDAAANALVLLASGRVDDGVHELIGELRETGALTTRLLIRAVCSGKIDFVARVLSDLSEQSYSRVTAILVSERETQLRALFDAAGLARTVHALFSSAIRVWRDVANGRLKIGAQEVTRMVMEEFEAETGSRPSHDNDDILALLRSIYLDMIRQNARKHAMDLAAA